MTIYEQLIREDEINDEKVKDLSLLVNCFDDFVSYFKLKYNIEEFIESEINKTYFIQSDASKSDAIITSNNSDKVIVMAEAAWTDKRKKHFIEFNGYLKSLPEIQNEAINSKDENTPKDVTGEYDVLKKYDADTVLNASYALNRDLLEDISGFEKAMNYFKYDFKMMAVFSLLLALFLDVGAFLIGCFLFSTNFFKLPK
ncbi:MAG: hypothetical protein A2Y21_04330 [Clostridiales bacterium GWC2_40_7]|nr:MAG: hypothetical protein A2Y21_04330 [Clostridiales bacterium GWC2_40_7]